ncbi:hypothetical protein C3747_137g66 [Trypanosoma cruzi]|uniref:Uncharacterized protein n=2 Tax=Trypanosoma cruzi TaxID=5693 RepID=Q4DEG0_TRYCC|nr:hypothetical protein, conserved [Trypanosoma cruzi]EAN90914.1 hypothetical protein, conserved [Trypanosoma cruzi]PWV05152.1 hypothetical protein C3747_137g66 [Trypanosoma cruzi]|eukprot:XP_812765.1 hypothetical protein [Trypanosoma cruzi strain CL Brener]
MSCRCTMQRLASRTPRRPRLPWLAPALAPHQQLDAGIAARHQADRKNLKKSKRPFANYFRNEYRSSPSYSPPVTRTDGNISSYNVVRLMTDGRRTWTPFWGRATGGVRTRRKRQDVLEPPAPQFGDDGLDRTIERLLEIRFQWDLGDDILASSLVTPSLRAMTEHCLPFAPCMGSLLPSQERKQEGLLGCVELDGEQIPLYVFRGRGRRKGTAVPKVNLGFNGVDTVPSVVLDATRGPLVSSPTETSLSVRWKATNREATSVSEVLRLLQSVGRVSVIGIPQRSLLLLAKALATAEVEDPAVSISLAIAAAEHYYDYSHTECLEMLRCLRRIAYVRGLTRLPENSTSALSLYRDVKQCQMFFAEYIGDAAPFLVDKVWSRLPEHVRRLTRRKLFLDLTDFLSLAVELHGWRIPYNLPNPVSSAMYASKYLFLRYTLMLDEPMLVEYAKCMSGATSFDALSSSSSPLKDLKGSELGAAASEVVLSPSLLDKRKKNIEEDEEEDACTKPLVLWLCVSLLVRLTAEALGDVLRHVEASMRQHVQLAREYEMAAGQGESRERRLKAETDLQLYLDRIALYRPRQRVYQCIGRRQPRKMRLRLIPLEAFPEIFRHTRLPFEAETRQAHISIARQRAAAQVDSPLVAVLARSALAEKHIQRACGALDWAAMILTQCTCIVRRFATPVKWAQQVDASAQPPTPPPPVSPPVSHSEAVDSRFVLCEAHVRSRVQRDMDCLFTHIPWQGLEEQLQTFSEEERQTPTAAKQMVTEEAAGMPDAYFLDDLLNPSKGDGTDCGSATGESGVSKSQATASTSAEREVQMMLGRLQESVERFQVAVADLIDAQEEYFLMS